MIHMTSWSSGWIAMISLMFLLVSWVGELTFDLWLSSIGPMDLKVITAAFQIGKTRGNLSIDFDSLFYVLALFGLLVPHGFIECLGY